MMTWRSKLALVSVCGRAFASFAAGGAWDVSLRDFPRLSGDVIVLEGCTGGEVRRNGESKVTIRNCAGVAQD